MAASRTIRLSEYQSVSLDAAGLVQASRTSIESLTSLLEPLVELTADWDGKVRLTADARVGSLRIGDFRIDVVPRLSSSELITLIRYAAGVSPEIRGRTDIVPSSLGMAELVCRIFGEELRELRRVGLSRQYLNKQDRLGAVRGRVDFVSSFPWNPQGMTALSCRYHELSFNNLDNQIVLAALNRALLLDITRHTRRTLLEHRQVWGSLAQAQAIDRTDVNRARERYTRLSAHYALAHSLAAILLEHTAPDRLYSSEGRPSAGLVVNIAQFFEAFVHRLVSEEIKGANLRVVSQLQDSEALIDDAGMRYRRMRTDDVVFLGDRPIAVLDAKYKEYWMANEAGAPEVRISNEDIYQLFFYSHRLRQRYSLNSTPIAMIVAPLPAEDESGNTPSLASQFRRIHWRVGNESASTLDLVLLPMTAILRRLRSGQKTDELVPRELRQLVDLK